MPVLTCEQPFIESNGDMNGNFVVMHHCRYPKSPSAAASFTKESKVLSASPRKVAAPQAGRRVHFKTKPEQRIFVPTIKVEDKSKLWWTDEQLTKSFYKNKRKANNIKSQRRRYSKGILKLMKSYKEGRDQVDEHLQQVAAADVRGLEQHIVPFIKLYRGKVRKAVLNLQHTLRRRGLLETESGRQLLKQKLMQASRPGQQLALKLAEIDRVQALESHYSEDDELLHEDMIAKLDGVYEYAM